MSIYPLTSLSQEARQKIRFVLTDVDDTLTWQGRLPVAALSSLVALETAGIKVIPVTGGCAGWSDMMARTLPVSGVITEGGACYIHKNEQSQLTYHFWHDEEQMRSQQAALLEQVQACLADYNILALARDQDYRLTDVAIDFAQDIQPPALVAKEQMLARLKSEGLNAKASSIHINVCQPGYDKYSMAKRVLQETYQLNDQEMLEQVLYVGDAPNDESMFRRFPLSVGVANIIEHLENLSRPPQFITQSYGGLGFAEVADYILLAQS
ncbi:HAD-IIB family hydrolase [Marinomonas epiphytica]